QHYTFMTLRTVSAGASSIENKAELNYKTVEDH
ncbi:MAG: hypothetical protein ACJATQ_001404, partial [Cellvibrionaceae bacterium]